MGSFASSAIAARCTCPGGPCTHHQTGEPCPNQIDGFVGVISDPATGQPVPGSEMGWCEICREHHHAERETLG